MFVLSFEAQLIVQKIPFGGVQCREPYDALSRRYSIRLLSCLNIKKPVALFPILLDYCFPKSAECMNENNKIYNSICGVVRLGEYIDVEQLFERYVQDVNKCS